MLRFDCSEFFLAVAVAYLIVRASNCQGAMIRGVKNSNIASASTRGDMPNLGTLDGMPPAFDDACDQYSETARQLCKAFCETNDCDLISVDDNAGEGCDKDDNKIKTFPKVSKDTVGPDQEELCANHRRQVVSL